jgi:eukaryotic-like serine/threonine-protein kinase
MSEHWKRWEGQVIEHKYQLRQFLGSTDHSAVFRAEYRDPEVRNAAVKFLAADLPHAEQVMADWKRAQELSHPNLLKIYSVGTCRIEEMDLLYAAMEYADENLGEILPQRALTVDEAREMLSAVIEVLVYLHVKRLTHGHIKPSNIVALGDSLRVTSDTIEPLVEGRQMRRKRDVYDAPEIPSTAYTPAADVWSLGVTLVETLTQQPAFLPFNETAEPVISPTLREPFREIATNALRRDPNARWTSLDIAAKLNPEAAEKLRAALSAAAAAGAPVITVAGMPGAPAASAVAIAPAPASPAVAPPPVSTPTRTASASASSSSVSPLAVPLSKEPPLGKQAGAKAEDLRPTLPPLPVPRVEAKAKTERPVMLPNYILPAAAVLLIIVGAIALPKFLHRETTQQAATTAPAPVPPAAATTQNSTNAATSSPAPTPSAPPQNSSPTSNEIASNSAQSTAHAPLSPVPTPAPATLHNATSPVSPRRASGSPDRGEVLDQILPKPSPESLTSIQGTVRVLVRVRVDAAGNVTQASFENQGPSHYFADLALKASKGWVFLSPVIDGHSELSEWLIRFDFTPRGVNAYPTQAKP